MTIPNYRESTGSATSWRRANCVIITNPLNNLAAASVSFTEEDVMQKGDFIVTRPAEGISATFDPNGTFDLLDPATGAVIRQVTHMELYTILYSLYISLAVERDNARQTLQNPEQ